MILVLGPLPPVLRPGMESQSLALARPSPGYYSHLAGGGGEPAGEGNKKN